MSPTVPPLMAALYVRALEFHDAADGGRKMRALQSVLVAIKRCGTQPREAFRVAGRPAYWPKLRGLARDVGEHADARELSIRALARAMVVQPPSLSRWLAGKSGPEEAERMAAAAQAWIQELERECQ